MSDYKLPEQPLVDVLIEIPYIDEQGHYHEMQSLNRFVTNMELILEKKKTLLEYRTPITSTFGKEILMLQERIAIIKLAHEKLRKAYLANLAENDASDYDYTYLLVKLNILRGKYLVAVGLFEDKIKQGKGLKK